MESPFRKNIKIFVEKACRLDLCYWGIVAWLIVLTFGYLDFRIRGDGLYDTGQSGFAALPKGMDYKQVYAYGTALKKGLSNYLAVPNAYPPFVTLFYLPLTFLSENLSYQVYDILLLVFLFGTIYFSLDSSISKLDRNLTVLISLTATALLIHTYPVNFSFERGNGDIVAAFFAALSLWSIRRGKALPAVLFLTISSQLKVYPAALAVLLMVRFGWRHTIYFIVLNSFLLLILGPKALLHFMTHAKVLGLRPFVWQGNHSIFSFVKQTASFYGVPHNLEVKARVITQIVLIATFAASALNYYRHRITGSASRIMHFSGEEIGIIGMAFSLMSLLTATSHDYKLVIHIVPFILLLSMKDTALLENSREARLATIIVAASTAFLFLPRFTPIYIRLFLPLFPSPPVPFPAPTTFSPSNVEDITSMKTMSLVLNFITYKFLSLKGKRQPNL